MKRQIGFFVIAGGIGFLIDAGLVYMLTAFADWHPIAARIPAFTLAVLATFILNYRLAFQAQNVPLKKAFVTYFCANGVAQGLNFVIYSALILSSVFFETYPLLALVIGSGSVMVLSFLFSKYWVFKA